MNETTSPRLLSEQGHGWSGPRIPDSLPSALGTPARSHGPRAGIYVPGLDDPQPTSEYGTPSIQGVKPAVEGGAGACESSLTIKLMNLPCCFLPHNNI